MGGCVYGQHGTEMQARKQTISPGQKGVNYSKLGHGSMMGTYREGGRGGAEGGEGPASSEHLLLPTVDLHIFCISPSFFKSLDRMGQSETK